MRGRLLVAVLIIALGLAGTNLLLADISLQQNVRLVTDIGLLMVTLVAVIITIVATANLVLSEQERGTIFLILPKPISIGTFIGGKFIGLGAASLIIYLILSLSVFGLAAFWYQLPWLNIGMTLLFGWLDLLVITALATLFASFSQPILATLLTAATYVIGHSLSLIVSATAKGGLILYYLGRVIYYLMPNLEKFNLRETYVSASTLPASYYLWGLFYAVSYITVCLILAQLALKRREW
ncbi:MAG: ABC transporter permease [bacterium]|nr:ABC transporter permease [bacterium]